MKTILQNKLWQHICMIMAMMVAFGGTAWAEEYVYYTLTPTQGSNNSYTGNCDISINGITWNLTGNSQENPWRIGGKSITNTDRALYSKTPIDENITKIEVTHGAASNIQVNSWTVIVAKDANFSSVVSTLTPTFTPNSTTTINRPDGDDWSNCYFKFVYNVTVRRNNNRYIQFTEAKFYAFNENLHTLWTEDFTDCAAGNNTPATCTTDETISYIYTGNNRINSETQAGGTSPELYIASRGTFTATIPLYRISGDLPLTFKTSRACQVSTTTSDVNVSGSATEAGTHTITFTGITPEMTSITIVFTNNSGSRGLRIDDINMTGYATPLEVAAPTFSVTEGSYYAPQSVELSCATEGATIYYSTDNATWTEYEGAISVTETTTLYAKAEMADHYGTVFTSDVNDATYTILPKNSVVFITEKSIPYGSPYTLTTGATDGVDVKTDGTVTASNSANTSIATVSGSIITPLAVGTTTITVASEEGSTYLAGNGTITVNVTAPEGVTTAPSDEYTETYTIPASGYGTYCSQYPIDFTRSFTNGETAYTVKEKTETLVRLHLIEQTSIKGGVGFVVKGTPGTEVTFRFTDSSNVPTPNMLYGTTAPTYIEYEAAYGMKNGGFHLNNAGVVPAHRAFIPNGSAGSVKALTLEFEEEDPTGIVNVNDNLNANETIYNLAGQRINKMQKGVNIVNGKKILK